VQRGGEVWQKLHRGGAAVVVDDAHLVVAEAIDAVFMQKNLAFWMRKSRTSGLPKSKTSHRHAPVGEIERVSIAASGRLAVQKVHALIAKISTRVVVDHVQKHASRGCGRGRSAP